MTSSTVLVLPGELGQFLKFCQVDQGLTIGTSQRHRARVKRLVEEEGSQIDAESIRQFLSRMRGRSDFNNYIKSFRVFFRDYKQQGSLIASFKFAHASYGMPRLYSKQELQRFYGAIGSKSESQIPALCHIWKEKDGDLGALI